MASPIGNKNATGRRPLPGRIWSTALRSAVLERVKNGEKGAKRIRKLAHALLDKAESGDVAALKEFGDRIEGKAPQALTGPDGGAIIHSVEYVIVKP